MQQRLLAAANQAYMPKKNYPVSPRRPVAPEGLCTTGSITEWNATWGKGDQPMNVGLCGKFFECCEAMWDRMEMVMLKCPDVHDIVVGRRPPEYMVRDRVLVKGVVRRPAFYMLRPSDECIAEVMGYMRAPPPPPRPPRPTGAVVKKPDFFGAKGNLEGHPLGTTIRNRHQPPTATNRQPPTFEVGKVP